MLVRIEDDFDLRKIADSGQCFRFNECGDGYSVVAGDKYVFVRKVTSNDDKTGETLEFDCTEEEFDTFWKNYFDLDTNYRGIRGLIDAGEDEYLYNASEYGTGIRILRQDPWEMLISFIISQRKNIPAIKASIEKRDEMDKNKKEGSLKIAKDALYIDTSNLTIDNVCAIIEKQIS